MQKNIISKSTKRNWERLNLDKDQINKKLISRANKRNSTKKIIPLEYIKSSKTIEIVKSIPTDYDIKSVLYTISLNLLVKNRLIKVKDSFDIYTENEYITEVLASYNGEVLKGLLDLELPKTERDILGVIYQSRLTEGKKNLGGSYYTPQKVLEGIIENINENDMFLDPCCGAGSFLLSVSNVIKNPENIYGCDIDENACFIAKINLILKYKNKKFKPNIFNVNFLEDNIEFPNFDVVATNPPWGAFSLGVLNEKFPQISSNETFSYFIVKSSSLICENGKMFFVLPESILNVKMHKDIRQFLLENFHINKIELHGQIFSSVLTNVITLHLRKECFGDEITILTSNKEFHINQSYYERNKNNVFSILDSEDINLLEKIYSVRHQTLDKKSTWAIGIVTGNNAGHIFNNPEIGEKIFSGKHIFRENISDTNSYIKYDRTKFQQIADEKIYRAKEKLVYKFISKKLIFAYDDKQRLFLNSANILIPKLDGYDIKTVLQFLNSKLFQYIYTKKFNELKVLKTNLMQLPFPYFNKKEYKNITDNDVYKIFNLSKKEISVIEKTVV